MDIGVTNSRAYTMAKFLTPKRVIVGLKFFYMVSRPAITMSNTKVPEETKKYTATREFCTELFGAITTMTVGSVIEWKLGQHFAKKYMGKKLAKKEFYEFLNNPISSAANLKRQKTKTAIMLASFIGAAFSGGILTPTLNNLFLNSILDKVIPKKKKPLPQIETNNQVNVFKQYNNFAQKPVGGF